LEEAFDDRRHAGAVAVALAGVEQHHARRSGSELRTAIALLRAAIALRAPRASRRARGPDGLHPRIAGWRGLGRAGLFRRPPRPITPPARTLLHANESKR